MKLLRWTLAGASFYVMYKNAIGKKGKGEDVFAAPDDGGKEKPAAKPAGEPQPAAKKPRKPRAAKAKASKPAA